jgi:tetratricopeptide (TPR) repeat protein
VQQIFVLLLILIAAPYAAADTTFLIFPPENLTKGNTLGWIGEGLAVAISEECILPGVETLSWEERVRFVEAADLPPNGTLSRASMIRVAQRAGVDRLVFGSYSGTQDKLRISLQVLDLKSLKLSGEFVANGPVSALPQLENELAWVILLESVPSLSLTRESFRARMRGVPNTPYAGFINALTIADEIERARLLQKAIDQFRDFPQASYFLGNYYFQSSDCARVIQYLRPALKSAQSYLDAQFRLGTCYLRQDNPAEAVQAYGAVVARYPSLEALNNLGVANLRKGDYPLAVQNLIEARKLAKSDMIVELNLAILRQLEGDQAAALAVLEDLVKAHPEQGMLQYLYSTALAGNGEPERAAAALERAQKLGIDAEKLKRQDPRSWTRIFPSWTRRSAAASPGGGSLDRVP